MTDISAADTEQTERAYEIDKALVNDVLGAIERDDRTSVIQLLDPLHSADIADLFEQISAKDRKLLIGLWGDQLDGEVLNEMDDDLTAEVIESIPDELVSEAVKDLETDDVVDLVEELDKPQVDRVLEALADSDRVAVEQALQYPEGTAGRLMQRELVMAPTHWTVGQTIDSLRRDDNLPEEFYHVIVVDPLMVPIGRVALSRMLSTKRDTLLSDLMDPDFRVIPVDQSQEDVAYAFNQYNMVSAPVVDDKRRLVGVITMDDAMDVMDEEAEEDIKRLAGVGDESLTDTILNTTKQRFPWLAVNLVTSVLASIVIAQFEGTIQAIVALAVLMPIVASMGGNAGTQTLTVAVRALATKDLTRANALRVIRRETLVGLLNGLVFAVIIGGVGVIWYGNPMLGVVLGLAMIANLLVAGIAGILVPITLDKLKIDPALASAAFVTTVTDIVGFFAFLGLAAAILF